MIQGETGNDDARNSWESAQFGLQTLWDDGIDIPAPNQDPQLNIWNATIDDWADGIDIPLPHPAISPSNHTTQFSDWNDGLTIPANSRTWDSWPTPLATGP